MPTRRDEMRQDKRFSTTSHNIDAEEIMGMFSTGKERAKNANVDMSLERSFSWLSSDIKLIKIH